MPTKDELDIAIKVINEVAGTPDSGLIAELVKAIATTETDSDKLAAKEVRIVEAKETR